MRVDAARRKQLDNGNADAEAGAPEMIVRGRSELLVALSIWSGRWSWQRAKGVAKGLFSMTDGAIRHPRGVAYPHANRPTTHKPTDLSRTRQAVVLADMRGKATEATGRVSPAAYS